MSKIEVNAIEPQCGTTLTLGASGDTITFPTGTTVVNNGTQTGFGRTGTVDWNTTPKTATFTAVSGDGFFANTTGGAFNMNLPAGVAGAIVSVADYAGTWQTNALTVVPNGTDKIGSLNNNAILNTEGQSVTFVFVDSTQGWINTMDSTSNVRGTPLFIIATGGTITTSGNDKIHTFTGPGTFCVSQTADCSANNLVSHIVVAGGGGGGTGVGGGGGAGGYREVVSPSSPYTGSPLNGYPSAPNRVTVTATAFPITVGGGGAGGSPGGLNEDGVSGTPSTFSTITSTAGGGGARTSAADPGGSGGGAYSPGGATTKGSGNTPPVSPPQGNPGGEGNSAGAESGGGGGGAGAVGGNGSNNPSSPDTGGPGGAGVTTEITASPVAYAGGGGGSGFSGTGGAGGSGGGGDSGPSRSQGAGTAGTTNTGGGGGAGNYAPGVPASAFGGTGGSGIVIIRYKFQ